MRSAHTWIPPYKSQLRFKRITLADCLLLWMGCVKNVDCLILGKPDLLPVNVLPRKLDVLRYWKHIKCAEEESGIIPVRKEIVDIVASDVQGWARSSQKGTRSKFQVPR